MRWGLVRAQAALVVLLHGHHALRQGRKRYGGGRTSHPHFLTEGTLLFRENAELRSAFSPTGRHQTPHLGFLLRFWAAKIFGGHSSSQRLNTTFLLIPIPNHGDHLPHQLPPPTHPSGLHSRRTAVETRLDRAGQLVHICR